MPNALFSHYSLLLDLKEPWKVSDVDLQVEHSRVEIYVEYGGSKTCCPECANACRVKDHAPQRQWRHLDTMNFETIIKARIPRSNCEDCGIKTVAVPWANKHSRFTLMFEGFAIAVLQAARSLDAGRQLFVRPPKSCWKTLTSFMIAITSVRISARRWIRSAERSIKSCWPGAIRA